MNKFRRRSRILHCVIRMLSNNSACARRMTQSPSFLQAVLALRPSSCCSGPALASTRPAMTFCLFGLSAKSRYSREDRRMARRCSSMQTLSQPSPIRDASVTPISYLSRRDGKCGPAHDWPALEGLGNASETSSASISMLLSDAQSQVDPCVQSASPLHFSPSACQKTSCKMSHFC